MRVDLGDHGEINRPQKRHVGQVEGGRRAGPVDDEVKGRIDVQQGRQEGMLAAFVMDAGAARRRRHVGRVEQPVIGRRHAKRRMRAQERHMGEPRRAAAPLQIGEKTVDQKGGLGLGRAKTRRVEGRPRAGIGVKRRVGKKQIL